MAEEKTNEMIQEPVQKENAQEASGEENWRINRDAAALAREKLQADNATANEEEKLQTDNAAANEEEKLQADNAAANEEEKPLSWKEKRRKEKEEAEAQKAAQKEAKARQKQEALEEKARQKQEALEEKARQKREALEEKLRRQQEKKEAKAVVKQERRKEVKSLWHTAEFALLVTFIVLAIDQAGIYGFLFVWLFVAVMVASIVLLLLGIVRAVRKKRSGIIFFAAIAGIILCTAWFIFLVSSQGLGLGPVPN